MKPDLLHQILRISRQVAQMRAIDRALEFAMQEATRLLNARIGYLVTLDDEREMEMQVTIAQRDPQFSVLDDTISSTILNRTLESEVPILVRDAVSDERFSESSSVQHLRIRSVLCVPLVAGGVLIGAIYIENRSVRGIFDEDDLALLTLFANQIAGSIQHAILIEDLERREAEKGWQDAVEANRVRTTLLGGLAHDMRVPLSVIQLSISMLENRKVGELTATQARFVERAGHAVGQLNGMIENVFDLSRLELGHFELNMEPVHLADFLKRVYDVSLALRHAEGVRIELAVYDELPGIEADPARVEQVLFNLIGNAIKFTTAGTITIHAAASPEGDGVILGVRDTGEGIPVEAQASIFERFKQHDVVGNRRRTGAGLGLAISRQLVEQHGGEIWVESTPGEGSDFQFWLPARAGAAGGAP